MTDTPRASRASWRGAARFGAIVLLVMIVAMWATRPATTCEMPLEPHRHLDLGHIVDREHLTTDLSDSERIAHRYADHLAAAPAGQREPTSPILDADQCLARLHGQIMAAHDVTPAQVVAATPRSSASAEATRVF
jgi:hypothetical protein